MATTAVQSLFSQTADAAAPLDITQELTPTDLVSYTFPATGGPWVTADGVTYQPDAEVFMKPVATIAANTLTDPLTIANVLLFNDFKESVSAAEAATVIEDRKLIVGTANTAQGFTGDETLTIPDGKTVGDLLDEYDEIMFTGHEYSLRNAYLSQRILTSEYRTNISQGNAAIQMYAAWWSSQSYHHYISNVNEDSTSFTWTKDNSRGHRNFKIWGIKKLAVAPDTVVIPAPDVTLTVNGGAITLGGQANIKLQPGVLQHIVADIPNTDMLATVAVDGTNATAVISHARQGEIAVFPGPDSTDITITTVAKTPSDAEYLFAIHSTTIGTAATNHHPQFNKIAASVGTSITLDTTSPYTTAGGPSIGRWTIKGNTGTYRIRGAASGSGSSKYMVAGIWNVTEQAWVEDNTMGLAESSTLLGVLQTTPTVAEVTPTVDTIYELRMRASNAISFRIDASYGRSWVEVEKIKN